MSGELKTYTVLIQFTEPGNRAVAAAQVLQSIAHGKVHSFYSAPNATAFAVFLQADCGARNIAQALYGAAMNVQTHAGTGASRAFSFLCDTTRLTLESLRRK